MGSNPIGDTKFSNHLFFFQNVRQSAVAHPSILTSTERDKSQKVEVIAHLVTAMSETPGTADIHQNGSTNFHLNRSFNDGGR